jgi:hypothetical protein
VVAKVDSDIQLASDRPAWMLLPPDRTLVFDPDGRRID